MPRFINGGLSALNPPTRTGLPRGVIRSLSMADYQDLQIHIAKPDANCYLAYFQMQDPSRDSYVPPTTGLLDCAPDKLEQYLSDESVGSEPYGRKLCKLLFTSPAGKSIGAKFSDEKTYVRLRLSIDSSAPELNQVAWEA